MRSEIYKMFLTTLILLIISSVGYAQEHNFLSKDKSQKTDSQSFAIFSDIENGFQNKNVSSIAKHLSQQPYLSFSNGVTGYYSSNQTYYILEEFFNLHRVISFKFENKKIDEKFAYATGTYFFEQKGKRDSKQVYLTLNKIGNNWYITQISIN